MGSAEAVPETQYTRSGDVYVAYQVFGEGPLNLVCTPGYVSNVELIWDDPDRSVFYRGLASFARVAVFDKRGTGASDRVVGASTLEQRMEDLGAVMDAAGFDRAALYGVVDGGALAALFAATHPERAVALLLWAPTARGRWAPDYPWGERGEVEMPWRGEQYLSGDHIDYMIRELNPSRVGDAEFRRRFARYIRLSASPSDSSALQRMWADVDIRHALAAIQAPTLVMVGNRDNVEEARYLVDRVAGARLIEFPTVEAYFYSDVPHVVAVMREFITSSWAEAPHDREPVRVLSTVLFTDLVAATAQASALGPQWRETLRAHNAVIRHELSRFRGREIDTAGDGFFASGFDGPARAIRCACAIRDAITNLGLGIRVGVHTGECDLVDGKLAGLAVNIGARVAAQAEEGEVLVSGTVKDLVAGSGITFEPRGTRELKGLGEWPLYAVVRSVEGLTGA